MKLFLLFLLVVTSLTLFSQTYYVVRHAEKAQASTGIVMATPDDPPLTTDGEQRAIALKDELKNKHIRYIYSTNTMRTRSTAKPLSDVTGVKIEIYNKADQAFIEKLKALHENVLIVGHSNTVDDIVNTLSGKENVHGDLPDTTYDNLYVVTIKGAKVSFEVMKYGKHSE